MKKIQKLITSFMLILSAAVIPAINLVKLSLKKTDDKHQISTKTTEAESADVIDKSIFSGTIIGNLIGKNFNKTININK